MFYLYFSSVFEEITFILPFSRDDSICSLKVSVSNLRRATFNLPYPEGSWPYKTVNETISSYIPVTDFLDAPFSFTLEKGLVTNIQVNINFTLVYLFQN